MEEVDGGMKLKMEEYEVIEQLGRGAFGASFLVLHKTQQKKYVMKKIRLAKQTEKCKRIAHQEMELLSKLRNPYILEYKDTWVDKDCCVCVIMDYCEGGDMNELIKKANGMLFPEEKVCRWTTQLLLAIDYLHSNRIVHRDLKCSNIFLTKENDIRVGDFGLSKLHSPDALVSTVVGTPNHMCPELLEDVVPYGYKSDIWSLGCCIFEIAAHQPAFMAADRANLINKINRSLLSPFPILYTPTLKQIIKTMLRKHPEHRPPASEVLRHPYMQPHLRRCRNASPVYLPVRSPNSKDKTPSKDSPVKSARDSRDKESRALKLAGSSEGIRNISSGCNHHCCDKSSTLITSEEHLETKRVDTISYSRDTYNSSERSKGNASSRKLMLCNSKELINVPPPEARKKLDAAKLQPWLKVSSESGPENGLVELGNQNENLTRKDVHGKSSKLLHKAENHIEFAEQRTLNSSSKVGSGAVVEDNADTSSSSTKAAGKAVHKEATEREREISLLRTISNALGTVADETKIGVDIPSHHKANALESLLELCALLLREDKLAELSGVLKPFGEEVVSSRETAIWLTKSLMAAQKSGKGS